MANRSAWLTQERFDAIRIGMSKAELVAAVGRPPGNYRTPQAAEHYAALAVFPLPSAPHTIAEWFDDDAYFLVAIDEAGKVLAKGYGCRLVNWKALGRPAPQTR